MTDQELKQAALVGYHDVPCKTIAGVEVAVRLRCIRYSETAEFLDKAQDEHAGLLYCLEGDLDPDQLDDESYDALMEANMELNFTVARARLMKKLARAEKTALGLRDVMTAVASLYRRFAPNSASTAGVDPSASMRASSGS